MAAFVAEQLSAKVVRISEVSLKGLSAYLKSVRDQYAL
jgi:hypothetical protein